MYKRQANAYVDGMVQAVAAACSNTDASEAVEAEMCIRDSPGNGKHADELCGLGGRGAALRGQHEPHSQGEHHRPVLRLSLIHILWITV